MTPPTLSDEELTQLEAYARQEASKRVDPCDRDMTIDPGYVISIVRELRAARKRLAELETQHPSAPARCPACDWSNTALLNYGTPGHSDWRCHGCAARAIQELARIRPVYERALEWAGANCSRMPDCDPYDGSHDAECLNSIADARLYSAIDTARSAGSDEGE